MEKLSNSLIDAALEHAVDTGEKGLQVAVYSGEELIVNTWTGMADEEANKPTDGNTLFPVFSVSKAFAATAIHIQAERGLIEYEAPLAKYWPEFAVNGKEKMTVRHVLTHRAGIPQMPEGTTIERICDWEWMVREIAALKPIWEPGSRNSYLAYTFGWLLGEVVRRTDPKHRPFGQWLQDEICKPMGIDGFFIGVPESETDRVGKLYAENYSGPPLGSAPYNDAALPKNVRPSPAVFNRRDVQAACIPAANGIANAESVARFFALLANHGEFRGKRLLSAKRLMDCTQLRDDPYQPDEVIGRPPLVGIGGYFLGGEYPPAEPVPGNFPHLLCQPGGGQSIAWADLDRRFSASICHNRMFSNFPPRDLKVHPFGPLGDAIRESAAMHRKGASR